VALLEPTATRLIRPEWALRVPSPAHDALAPEARRRYVADNPDSFLTVTRGPEDLDPDEEWDSARAVRDSQASLGRLLEAGAYSDLAPPAFYLYRLSLPGVSGSHSQIGIVGNAAVEDYEQGVIRVHEQVHEHRARHLADHLGGLQIQSSPIALAYRADPALTSLVTELARSSAPLLDFVAPDGLHQQVWRVDRSGPLARAVSEALADAPLYLIDGHHRAAAASHHRRQVADPGADWMLSVLFPADGLHNEAFHRLVHGVEHRWLLALLGASFPVRSGVTHDEVADRGPDDLALLTGAAWHLIGVGPPTGTDPLDALDTMRLERRILEPLLGLTTTAPGQRLSYRVGDPDPAGLGRWRTGPDEALWLMRPVPMDVVLDAADAGVVMPPKSTFFQPKARSGVFLRPAV
jgi:uncharacterized protein (DUF1015 family)